MQHCDTLISVDWCIPVEPDRQVLEACSVAVADGRVVAVLPTSEARATFDARTVIDRPGHVLIPGFVNAHSHAAMTLMRGMADDLPLDRWLKEAVWPAEARWAGAEMVRDGTRLAIAELLLSGCTCLSDQYFFPEIVAETAADMNMRAMVGTPVTEYPTQWATSPAEYLSKGTDLVHDPFADHPLISTCFAPHSTLTVSDATFADLRVLADQLDKPVQIHLHESGQEVATSVDQTGKRPLERLQDLGLVNSSLMAVHAVHVSENEIHLLADSGVVVAHCPRSNLKLADGIAPVQDILDAGITVGLGTDGAASNNVLDMPGEMRAAALLAKARADSAAALPAADALRMATLEGAKALGLGAVTGSIEPGKWADLTCIDLMHLNSQPVYDPISQVVYTVQPHQVRDVWVAGRHQVEDGRLSLIDTSEILRRASEWQRRMSGKED
jgi:5-methylthioadenosine/S-adenosylhomocysteine deaminase